MPLSHDKCYAGSSRRLKTTNVLQNHGPVIAAANQKGYTVRYAYEAYLTLGDDLVTAALGMIPLVCDLELK